jgi:hypothetical protein
MDGGGACDLQPNPELYDPVSGRFTLTGPSSVPPNWGLSTISASLLPSGNVLGVLYTGCDIGSLAEVYDWVSGTFTGIAGVGTGRAFTTTTLLPEGRVFIAGRDYTNRGTGGTAEVYNPPTGAFTAISGVGLSEEGYTATLLPDGSVLLAGGWLCCGYETAMAEIYRPAHPAPSPVLYSLPGGTQGAILHGATQELVSPENPATAGEVLEIFGAGLMDGGAIPPQASIGGQSAEVLFFGNAPGYPGLNQINVRVPIKVQPGSAVIVRMNYLGRPSNEVKIGVRQP